MEKPIRVTCAIIIKNNKILAAQRSESMHLPLSWEFPGGKVEKAESEQECLVREIKEELNIDIEVQKRLSSNSHQYSGKKPIVLIPFVCQFAAGQLVLKEHKKADWFTLDELKDLDWAAADIPVVEEFTKLFQNKLG